ncbi:Response regulator rcp1 [Neolewinella maritima]|uniref:Response regulator rcp1 n=1 Tax=Neolewinella maritima TaxID=1383882 RepID=A0ABM9B4W1_9BACT|nr:response regulator [Neolewinella maritima]CAH1001925.1 Response regulator rcp1 [Neolewinella maritima]
MSTHRILLIEDDASEAHLAQRTLHKINPELEITRLTDGEAFLDYYHQHPTPEQFDLAIMDLHMPRATGLEVLKVLQDEPNRTPFPIVMFSSSENDKEIEQAYDYGSCAFVTKPSSGSAYRQALKNIIRFWIDTNRRR